MAPPAVDPPRPAPLIVRAVRRAMSPGFAEQAARAVNPYGQGGAAESIIEVLRSTALDDRLMIKCLTF